MAKPDAVAADLYPGEKFETDYDVYLRVAKDMVAATAPMEVPGSRFHIVATEAGHLAFCAVEAGLEDLYAGAAYTVAYSRYSADQVNNNRNGLFELVYQLTEATDPLPEHTPLPITAAERQENDFAFADSLRRKPRFEEGRFLQAMYGEYCVNLGSDEEKATVADRFATERDIRQKR